jgi:predicted ATPase/class 3 adenylate cyclase
MSATDFDVGRWLAAHGFERFAAVFEENEVDAQALLQLEDEHLKELGIPLGPRVKLAKALEELRKAGTTETTVAPAPAGTPPPADAAAGGERRHLTVMFVDLVGSTELSTRLDPEDMSDLIRSYQDTCAGVITRFDGHVAKYMGDGVLAYFGWPRAHEDDAERAVRTGLEITEAVGRMTAPDESLLAARVGIASGLTVVGELVGDDEARERAVIGETPNLASRVEGLAGSGKVAVAESTRRLLGERFDVTDLGEKILKGIAEPVRVYTVSGERHLDRFAARGEDVLPMIGRDQELALILERWQLAEQGEGQAVLLVGEAGIGKSRILRAVFDELDGRTLTRVRYNCSPYYSDSAFWPVAQQLSRAAAIDGDDSPDAKLGKLASILLPGEGVDDTLPLFASLLGIDAGPALDMEAQQQRIRTLTALVDQMLALALHRPVLVTLEDAHWVDPTTLEMLQQALDQIGDARVLMLLTSRPDNQPDLAAHPHVTRLTLNRLGRAGVEAIVQELSPERSLPTEVIDAIIARTDGVPLFVEELTKAVIETGETTVPATLHDSLMARLDRIPDVKEVAQVAACIGREFAYGVLANIIDMPQTVLTEALGRLTKAALVFQRGSPPMATYTFKHALVQDTAYASLLRSRRKETHRRIADALGAMAAEGEPAAPELIARHLTEAGELAAAIPLWKEAGEIAVRRSANVEAISHLTEAIRLIDELPPSPDRLHEELKLVTAVAGPLIATKGYGAPETAEFFTRAQRLAERVDDARLYFPTLYGRWVYEIIRAEHSRAIGLAQEFIRLTDGGSDPGLTLMAHRVHGVSLFETGRPAEAHIEFATAVALYDQTAHGGLRFQFGQDPYAAAMSFMGIIDVALGNLVQARANGAAAVAHAEHLQHANTTGYVLTYGAFQIAWALDEYAEAAGAARSLVTLAEEYDMALWLAYGQILLGWALAMDNPTRAGPEMIRQGLDALDETGTLLHRPQALGMLAQVLGRTGNRAEALDVVAAAIDLAVRQGEAWIEPELHRINGELLARDTKGAGIEALEHSLSLATARDTPWWQLRTTNSLAELLAKNGDFSRGLELLEAARNQFDPTTTAPPLARAAELMAELAATRGQHNG